MTFTTLTFCLFLVAVFAAYWTLRTRKAQNFLLVVVNYVFYGWWDWRFCLLMLFACTLDFFIGRALQRTSVPFRRRILLTISVGTNLGVLGFFKYFNFFMDSLTSAGQSLGWSFDPFTLRILLPVGISFYTFQTMSYVIDVYRKELDASESLIEYLAYISFFPQLVAGPIERAGDLLPQFQQPRCFDNTAARDGCRLILWGFFKKLCGADGLGEIVSAAYRDIPDATGPQLVLATVCFAAQIYFDFSAYSDIASGAARLFGFNLMRNFAYPYFSQSLSEFWRRWHVSLSSWFRDYVFIPLGGSRRGKLILIRNLVLTFLISGLWHGANWTYVIWGGIMGVAVAIETVFGDQKKRSTSEVPGGPNLIPSPAVLARMTLVWLVVGMGWVFFRAPNVASAWLAVVKVTGSIFTPSTWSSAGDLIYGSRVDSLIFVLVIYLAEWIQRSKRHPLAIEHWTLPKRWALYTCMIWVILIDGSFSGSQFIYFQF